MALLYADAFDSYGASADMAQNWFSNSLTWDATAGRLGGGAMKSLTTACAARTPFSTLNNTVTNGVQTGFACWIKITATPSAQLSLMVSNTAAGAATAVLVLSTTGLLGISQSGGAPSASGSTNICDSLWHFIDFRWSSNSVSACWVDGTTQWNGTAIANGNVFPDYAVINTAAQGNYFFDDLFWFDFNTPAPVASTLTPLAPLYMTTIRPSADSAVTFSRSSGSTNFSLVNSTAADDDTSYVQNATVGQADEYDFDDLTFTPLNIYSIQQTIRAKNPGAGSTNLKARCHSGATTSDGSSVVVSSNYNNFRRFNHTDPNTAAAWSGANLNSAKFGYVVA